MEENKNEYELTLTKVLSFIFLVCAGIGAFALIWAQWRTLQVCASIDLLIGIVLAVMPASWD